MRRAPAAVLTLLLIVAAAAAQQIPDDLRRFREMRDAQMRDPAQTALPRQQILTFKGLEYFSYAANFKVEAVFEKTSDKQTFLLPMSSGTTRKFVLAGILKFELGGRTHSLKAFRSEFAKPDAPLFVPFRDSSNGVRTYSAGRYLDIHATSETSATVDFNFAYNPSCAYGDPSFTCPLPPKENFLDAEISAGELVFGPSAAKH